MTVQRARVGDVLSLQRRAVDVEPDGKYEEIGVRSFGRGIFHKEPVSGAYLGAKRVFRIEPGDLVISNVFAWEGAIAVASEAEAGRIGSHRFMTFVPADRRVNTSWASWFFRSEPGLELIRMASPGSAGRNRTLAIERFKALEIPVPSIDVQHRQVKYLDTIANCARAAADSFNRETSDGLVALLPGLVDRVVERKAVGRAKVGELADFISDIVHPGDDPHPADTFVGLQHIESHTGRRIGSDNLESMKGRKFRFRPGDLLYGYLRPYLNKVWVADRHGLCSVDQYVLRPAPGVSAQLLAHCLRGRQFLSQAIDLTHSLQLPRLRSGLLASLEVPILGEDAAASLVGLLDVLRDQLVDAAARRSHQSEVVRALVPSALNEAFGGLS
jgi:type I restriction enzyme S subunit